ncbi:MAG: NAD-dependent epimerase/dehydratase family protein [Alphaproteobacteria bacterium]|nr:NAD-dependent epimerase/dehydratase family protein [Alphaproteobacteria bacterium]
MRVFVTGATGFIGMAVTKELIAAGHKVLGLARSREKAVPLAALGAEVLHGTLEEPAILKRGVTESDGVIHTAFNHDFSRYAANSEDDRRVIATLGEALAGSKRPLIVTSGTGIVNAPGRLATEDDPPVPSSVIPRAASEEATTALAAQGVNASAMRLPQIHDTVRQGFVTYLVMVAREKKMSAYVGDGRNRWPACHVLDTARLYRLALEKAERGARYHAVGEEGIALKDLAEAIARRLNLPAVSLAPDKAAAHFGWIANFAAADAPASSKKTQERLGWRPTGVGMLADIANLQLDA